MKLGKIQDQFKTLLLGDYETLKTPPASVARLFQDNGIALHEGLEVYHGNVQGSLTTLILENFPMIQQLTGEDFACAMAKTYVAQNPPPHGCLTHYGEDYDHFIARFKHAQMFPFLPSVAQLEIAMNRAYNAADDSPLDASMLGQVPPESLPDYRLTCRNSSSLITSTYDLFGIKALCDTDSPIDFSALKRECRCRLMAHRPELDVVLTPLAEDEFMFLEAITNQRTLGEALEATLSSFPEFDIQSTLSKHVNLGSFSYRPYPV